MGMWCCSNHSITPTCARARAPPPSNASPILGRGPGSSRAFCAKTGERETETISAQAATSNLIWRTRGGGGLRAMRGRDRFIVSHRHSSANAVISVPFGMVMSLPCIRRNNGAAGQKTRLVAILTLILQPQAVMAHLLHRSAPTGTPSDDSRARSGMVC